MHPFDALQKFINQKPNLDFRNYGDRQAYWSESRSIQKDGTRARKALREARSYPYNESALLDSFKQAFAGRLEWDGERLDYCTGQYYPTEYRKAAASVLERYCHEVKPKFSPPDGMVFSNMDQIEQASLNAGSHWFEPSTKRFFRSRMLSTVYHGNGGVYFVSSEQGPNGIRAYTIRKFNPKDADIDTFGPFNELTRERALRLAKIASENPAAALEVLGYKLDEHGYQVKV